MKNENYQKCKEETNQKNFYNEQKHTIIFFTAIRKDALKKQGI